MEQDLRKAAVMYDIDKMDIVELPIPDMGKGDVLIRVKAVGICGSDVHFFKEGRIGKRVIIPPHILGHECAGEITKIGEDVKNLSVGNRVAVEPQKPCGKCEWCMKGRYNLCEDMIFMSAPHSQRLGEGAFVEYIVRPSNLVYPIPDHVSYEEAAMAEPLAVALQAIKMGKVTAGDTTAIMGAGPIALAVLLAAEAYGCKSIFMTDLIEYRLKKAAEMGATKVFNVTETDYVNEILELTGGRGVDTVIETTGNEKAFKAATDLAARGGTIVLVASNVNSMALFDTAAMQVKELGLVSIFRYSNVYKKAVDLIASGKANVKQLITHKMPLEKVAEGINLFAGRSDGVIKVIINI